MSPQLVSKASWEQVAGSRTTTSTPLHTSLILPCTSQLLCQIRRARVIIILQVSSIKFHHKYKKVPRRGSWVGTVTSPRVGTNGTVITTLPQDPVKENKLPEVKRQYVDEYLRVIAKIQSRYSGPPDKEANTIVIVLHYQSIFGCQGSGCDRPLPFSHLPLPRRPLTPALPLLHLFVFISPLQYLPGESALPRYISLLWYRVCLTTIAVCHSVDLTYESPPE